MAMYYTIASRGTAGTEPLQVRRGRKLKERRPIARSARGAAGWRARLPPPRNPNACLRTASNNSTQYRNVNYRLTLPRSTAARCRSASGRQGPPRSRHGGTRPQFHVRYTEHSKSAYRLRGVVISARPDATGRVAVSALAISRFPPGGCPWTRAPCSGQGIQVFSAVS